MSDNAKIVNGPERIFLVYGDVSGELRDIEHSECDDVTWCEESQFDSDIAYVRADLTDTNPWRYPSRGELPTEDRWYLTSWRLPFNNRLAVGKWYWNGTKQEWGDNGNFRADYIYAWKELGAPAPELEEEEE